MQLRNFALALVGISAAVDASVLRGRPELDIVLLSRQNNGKPGFGGAGAGFGGQANNNAAKGTGANNNNAQAAAAAAAAKASQSAAAAKNAGNNGANAAATNNNNNNNNNNAATQTNNNNAQLCLSQNALQTGSQQDGSQGASAGQATSKTDKANFINFCSGKTLTNGLQQKQGSCNGIPMGEMPAQANMVSTIITSPLPGKEPAANKDFNVVVKIANMQLGTFTNPDSTYYAAPQQLGNGGDVIGHTHITIQDLGNSLTPTTPLDASKFAFFKGINDAGDGKGTLQATVTGGLPAGNYRVCTMAGSSNHQPVLMPVAQRGAQDDCVRLTIGNGNNANANAANANANNANANNANANNANANANANKGANGGANGGRRTPGQ